MPRARLGPLHWDSDGPEKAENRACSGNWEHRCELLLTRYAYEMWYLMIKRDIKVNISIVTEMKSNSTSLLLLFHWREKRNETNVQYSFFFFLSLAIKSVLFILAEKKKKNSMSNLKWHRGKQTFDYIYWKTFNVSKTLSTTTFSFYRRFRNCFVFFVGEEWGWGIVPSCILEFN